MYSCKEALHYIYAIEYGAVFDYEDLRLGVRSRSRPRSRPLSRSRSWQLVLGTANMSLVFAVYSWHVFWFQRKHVHAGALQMYMHVCVYCFVLFTSVHPCLCYFVSVTYIHTIRTCKLVYIHILQCPSGMYSADTAPSCTACPAGKYLTNSSGRTEAAACTNVSHLSMHECVCMHIYVYEYVCINACVRKP